MKDDNIRQYDESLLSKERGIKAATVVIDILIALAVAIGILFPCWMALQEPSDMDLFSMSIDHITQAIGWLIVLILLETLNRSHLKHIASIKLNRKQ